jgi:hypothetical protein
MSANRSGFAGAPALLVLPSRASPAKVSKAISVLLTGEDLETLLLLRMDVIRTRSPAGLTDPIDLEQLAARILGGLPELGPQPRHRVY